MNNNQKLIDSLHLLASFLESKPDFPVVTPSTFYVSTQNKEGFANVARALERTEKAYDDYYARVSRMFGEIKITGFISREQVCRKVIKGTKVIPAQPAVPEHEEEIIEWVCNEPILATKE